MINNQGFFYLKILFYHEDEFETRLFKEQIKELPHKFLFAYNREEALEILNKDKSAPMDLFIGDFVSIVGETSLAAQVKKLFPETKILIFTSGDLSHVTGYYKENKKAIIPEGIIHKGEPPEKLIYFIESILEEKKDTMINFIL